MQIEAMRRKMEINNVFYTTTPLSLLTGDRAVWGGVNYPVQFFFDEGGQGRVYSIATLLKS